MYEYLITHAFEARREFVTVELKNHHRRFSYSFALAQLHPRWPDLFFALMARGHVRSGNFLLEHPKEGNIRFDLSDMLASAVGAELERVKPTVLVQSGLDWLKFSAFFRLFADRKNSSDIKRQVEQFKGSRRPKSKKSVLQNWDYTS